MCSRIQKTKTFKATQQLVAEWRYEHRHAGRCPWVVREDIYNPMSLSLWAQWFSGKTPSALDFEGSFKGCCWVGHQIQRFTGSFTLPLEVHPRILREGPFIHVLSQTELTWKSKKSPHLLEATLSKLYINQTLTFGLQNLHFKSEGCTPTHLRLQNTAILCKIPNMYMFPYP